MQLSDLLYRRTTDLEPISQQLERIKPDVIWSTVCASPYEYPYLLAARDLSIPVVTSILSFDNLTSRSAYAKYDHYLVWNEVMRDQLLKFYPDISSERVTITGTPQFDFHRRPELTWDRAKTLESLQVPAQSRYFLYAASHESLAPDEPALVALLAERMSCDRVLNNYYLVLRLHPLDDGSRWKTAALKTERLILCHATESATDADQLSLASLRGQARLISSMVHSEGCINIASTMSLDAAILDRPVIGIEFSGEADAPQEIMYEEYKADHYESLVRSGGLSLAHNWNELIDLMHSAIDEPTKHSLERSQMVRTECGIIDGRAAERVVQTLQEFLRHSPLDAGATHTPACKEQLTLQPVSPQ